MSPAPTRHLTLDGLRGVAVMGILLMNIGDFGWPQIAYLQPLVAGRSPADVVVWAVQFVLADGKFRNLFSLLFGASMLLVADRAEAAGRSGSATHYNRMAWLFLFGIAHLYLVWFGDILHHYALVGALAFLLRRMAPRKLVALGITVLGLYFVLMAASAGGLWWLRASAEMPHATAAAIAKWNATTGPFKPTSAAKLAHEIAVYRGGYPGELRDRLARDAGLPLGELLFAGPETFALMLFGMAALRSGFLTGGWSRAAYRRVALIGYGVGLPWMALLAWWTIASGFDPLVSFTTILALSLPVRAAIMLAHASLLILWLTRAGGSALARRVAAAGRMAFTNYLATSVVMAAIFYGWGAGRFATIGPPALLLPVTGMWAAMLLWSLPWLRRCHYGPMEWAWRSLARRAPQPMRRTAHRSIAMHSQ